MTVTQLTGVVYSQSTVYPGTIAADYAGMNDGTANATATGQTGTGSDSTGWIMADCGAPTFIGHIVIGYDYLSTIPGGFNAGHLQTSKVQVSVNGTTWTDLGYVPVYSSSGSTDGLVPVNIGQTARYVRIYKENPYCGLTEFQVWGGEFDPTDLSGCTVWIDASQLSSITTQWPDLSGNNHHGAVVGTPVPTIENNAPNGRPVARFTYNEARIRGDGMVSSPTSPLTIICVGRQWGPNVGRIFTNTYPPYNFLVGTHSSGYNCCYDNGWVNSGSGWPTPPADWTIWGFTYDGTTDTFYVNGTASGTSAGSAGHDSKWNISGYDPAGTQETCDCEVAELIVYDRVLTTTERQQVEQYVYTKWWGETAPESVPVSAALSGGGTLSATVHKWASPADTPGLGLWLDASAITGLSPGDPVTAWPDSSSAARHATAVDGNKPIYHSTSLNGHPAVYFGGASRRVSIPGLGTALSGKTQYTLFYVAQVATFGYSVVATAPTNTLWRWLLEYEPSGGFYWGHSNGNFWQYTPILASNVPHRLTFHHTPSGPHFYVNGTEHTSYYTNGAGLGPTVDNVDGDVLLGAYYEGSYPVDGVIAEFIFYDHALTTAERLQVEDYLNQKYFGAAPTPVPVSFSGAGALGATAAESYARAPALAGSGTLSATVTKVAPTAAPLTGGGALTATIAAQGGASAPLTATGALSAAVKPVVPKATFAAAVGTLSATVRPIYTMPASFGSTGQLQIAVTALGAEPPDRGGGWTTDSNPPPPTRMYGPGWATPSTVGLLQKPQGSGWHALLQRVTRLRAEGTLQMTMQFFVGKPGMLSGAGQLAGAVVQRNARAAAFTAGGVLVGEGWPLKTFTVPLTSLGTIDFGGINEGLHGTIQVGYASRLNGEGTLTTVWEGGNPNYDDGLTGVVIGRYVIPGIFASTGALTAFASKLDAAFTYLSAHGFLTASTTQIYPLVAGLAASGQLSATTFFAYQKLVDLIGTGTLSATAFAAYLRSLGVSGAGTLTALLVASYQGASSAGGVGSVTATVSQVYSPAPALAAEGTLTAAARPFFDGLWGEVRKL